MSNQFQTAGRIIGGLWVALFGLLVTFIMGVVVWAVAGPVLATIIFVLVVLLFVVFPFSVARRRTTKTPPHPGG